MMVGLACKNMLFKNMLCELTFEQAGLDAVKDTFLWFQEKVFPEMSLYISFFKDMQVL